MEEELPNYMQHISLEFSRGLWFQQDGAPSHFARQVTVLLKKDFPKWLTKRGGSSVH